MKHDHDTTMQTLGAIMGTALAARAVSESIGAAASAPPDPDNERLRVDIKMRGGDAAQVVAYLRGVANDIEGGLLASRAYRGSDGMAVDVNCAVDEESGQ